jgi:uncharacterized protein (TIGR03032 family)
MTIGPRKIPPLKVSGSRSLGAWMAANDTALAFTSHRLGALFFFGLDGRGGFYCRAVQFRRASGLWLAPEGSLYVGEMRRIWRLENVLATGERARGHDRLYQPRQAWTVGEVDVHELARDRWDRLVFANTQYSCLATTHPVHAFQPLWAPPVVSALEPQDRCHLNGLAMANGITRYVTMLGVSDAREGWRADPQGGVLMEAPSGRVAAGELWMPHSPRLHEGALYVLESGRGMLVRIDPMTGGREDLAFAPGFLRGLSFHGRTAAVTLSLPRGDDAFQGLPLHGEILRRLETPTCGVRLFDLDSGDLVGRLELEGPEELFDLVFLPGCLAPAGLPLEPAEGQVSVSFEPEFAPLAPEKD